MNTFWPIRSPLQIFFSGRSGSAFINVDPDLRIDRDPAQNRKADPDFKTV